MKKAFLRPFLCLPDEKNPHDVGFLLGSVLRFHKGCKVLDRF